jgi:hypothetical protein
MTVGPEADAPRPPAGDGFADSLTFAFGDPVGDVFGVARLGLAGGTASGLAIVFRGGAPVAVAADGGVEADASSWDTVAAAGLRTETREPLASWRVAFDGEVGFDLVFDATSPPIELAADAPAARAGGMEGFDQVCRVHGTVGGAPFEGLGQRGRSWGAPDWDRMTMARTVSAWLDAEHAVSLVAVRPAKASEHGAEELSAFVFDADRADAPVLAVSDPRLSTAYDGDGHQRRAGLELYVGEEDGYARRAAGEVVAGTSLDLGRLRLDCAFFRWRMEGRTGVGRYDVLRRA